MLCIHSGGVELVLGGEYDETGLCHMKNGMQRSLQNNCSSWVIEKGRRHGVVSGSSRFFEVPNLISFEDAC